MRKINIIPLGENCIPRTILTRWKVKPKKLMGEPTYPFDLAVFGMLEVTKTLKTDFNEIFDNLVYKDGCWVKAPNCIYFYHDKQFNENDKNKLIYLYKKRIENFRKAIASDTPVLFIQITGDCEDVEQQYSELKKLRGDKQFKFAVIDTQNLIKKIFNEDIRVLKLPFPGEEYKNNWWKKEYYKTKEGILFEQKIAQFALDVINLLK